MGYYAFTSAASNLVSNDTNGRQDVFVLRRGSSPGSLGGALQRASVSSSGQQGERRQHATRPWTATANHSPHCVAFQSNATNLSAGGQGQRLDYDVYVRNLRTRRTTLVSVGQDDATDPVIDGGCEFVTYDVRRHASS